MIAQILSIGFAAMGPSEHHSVADMICPAGALSCAASLPDWVYRVQAPTGNGMGWAPYAKSEEPLPWRFVCTPRPSMDSLLVPLKVADTDSGWSWDAQGRFPVVGAFVGFDVAGASGNVVVEARNAGDKNWQFVGGQPCWNVLREGKTVRQDSLRWPDERRFRFWRVRPVGSRATLGGTPRLVLMMRRDRVEVATGGADTLVWAAGSAPGRDAAVPSFPQTIPVVAGPGRIGEARKAQGESAWAVPVSTRTWVLWVALVGFLAVLGLFATKLLREAFGTRNTVPPAA